MKHRAAAHPILAVPFCNSRYPTLGIEPMRLSELSRRVSPDHFAPLQRPEFHLLLLFTNGCANHYLDFERVKCRPGTLIHVRPGQVQQFRIEPAAEAHIVLFTAEFVSPERLPTNAVGFDNLVDQVLPDGIFHVDIASNHGLTEGFAAIAAEYIRTDGSPISAQILQHLLQILLLRVARASASAEPRAIYDGYLRTFRRFAKLVDRHFSRTRAVVDYAHMLGCSEKTLSRACLACRDVPPKEFIGRRVALEAKRLLAHTGFSIDGIAGAVGFSETTNFVKFFRCRERVSPTEFRARFPGHHISMARPPEFRLPP